MESEMYFDNVNQPEEQIPKKVRHRKKQLYSSIRERMEFYFSDANLRKDRYLSQLVHTNKEVDLSVFLKFNKIRQLTESIEDIAKSLRKSELLQLTEDRQKVFRITQVTDKENIDECTIYVEQLTQDADHDWLTEIFSNYGKVDYVSIPKYKNTGKIKGFAFVEFEKPEHAKSAVDAFAAVGCCLTTHMDPGQLCSINTFEDDKNEGVENTDKTVEVQIDEKEPENKDLFEKNKKHRKRKTTEESETTVVEKEDVVKRKKAKKEEKEAVVVKEESENEKESIEKDAGASEEKVEGKKEIVEESGKESKEEIKVVEEGEKITEETEGVPVKKKKNRKKKKSHKHKYVNDVQSYGLQILPKNDWKRLRNKYLNLQREKMKILKQQLHKSQQNTQKHGQRVNDPRVNKNKEKDGKEEKPRFTLVPGLIVKVVFPAPVFDQTEIKKFKAEAKCLENVQYVDLKEGSQIGYIRFDSPQGAQSLVSSSTKLWEDTSLLTGPEEIDYWDTMKKDREEKFGGKVNIKKRGRNKLMNKAEKLISKRIRLSVDE